MKIGIIGAGKVGTTLGKYFSTAGIEVAGFYSRTKESADEAATFTKTTAFRSLKELTEHSDTIFITTPDGAIEDVWKQLVKYDIKGYILCHFSGSLSSHVFSGIEQTGASGASVHPMYAFSDKFTSYEKLNTAYCSMEGDAEAVHVLKPLFEKMGNRTVLFAHQDRIEEDKMKYHAAAAMASNFMVGLFQCSLELLEECGFTLQEAKAILQPMVEINVEAMLKKGCVQALTGPLERADVETLTKHLQAIAGTRAEEAYRGIVPELLHLAQQKNPGRDYQAVKELFSHSYL